MRISDWSSDVCSSDLAAPTLPGPAARSRAPPARAGNQGADAGEDAEERAAHPAAAQGLPRCAFHLPASRPAPSAGQHARWLAVRRLPHVLRAARMAGAGVVVPAGAGVARAGGDRKSEEHTSELQSLMRI